MRIVAVDPGKMSGFAEVKVGSKDRGVVRVAQYGLDELGSLASECDPVDVLIFEDFVLYAGAKPGSKWDSGLSPVHVTGWLMGKLGLNEGDIRRQMPSEAKGVVTDERLKRLGLWVPGKDHARDAIRHCVLYARKQGMSVQKWVLEINK